MSLATKSLAFTAAVATLAGAAVYMANAQDTKMPSTTDGKLPPAATTPAGKAPAGPSAVTPSGAAPAGATAAEASKPESWVGMPVISSDGATVGQVASVKPGVDGKTSDLVVKNPSDGKTLTVPGNLASLNGNSVQLKATSDQLGKMVN